MTSALIGRALAGPFAWADVELVQPGWIHSLRFAAVTSGGLNGTSVIFTPRPWSSAAVRAKAYLPVRSGEMATPEPWYVLRLQ